MTTRAVAESSADARKTGREREWTRVYNKVESEKDVFTHLEVFWISYPLSAKLFRDGNHEPVQGTTRKIELRAWKKKNFVSGLPRFWIGTDLWTIFCRRKFNPCKHFGRVTGDAIILLQYVYNSLGLPRLVPYQDLWFQNQSLLEKNKQKTLSVPLINCKQRSRTNFSLLQGLDS